ncbi:hypothetical protein LR004_01745, partial [Candidatus Gracilibacteria bacterium]|nr:hypothetical protein [Candidatus Gracilibacteria bacterium]
MILYRQSGKIFDQEELAEFFNVKIHPSLVSCFTKKFETTDKINDDEGLKTIEEEERINDFFQEKNIELKAEAYHLSKILAEGTLSEFINICIEEDKDMWVEYKLEGLFSGNKGIHDGLIESISEDKIVMINPGYDTPNRYTFDINQLEEALSKKFARETG